MESRRKVFKNIFYLAIALSLILYLINFFKPNIFGDIGSVVLVLGIVASIISNESPTKIFKEFNKDDWKWSEKNNDYFIYISASDHGMGKNTLIQCTMKDDGNLNKIRDRDLKYDEDGGEWVSINGQVECRITIFN